MLLLAGEPGISKTRLAREVALQAHAEGALVLYGRCEEDLGAPYQPFVEALDFFLTRSPLDGLASRLGRYAGELSRLCPVMDELVLGLDPPLRSDTETERYRLFEGRPHPRRCARAAQPRRPRARQPERALPLRRERPSHWSAPAATRARARR